MLASISITYTSARRYRRALAFCAGPVFFWRQQLHHFQNLSFQRFQTFTVEV